MTTTFNTTTPIWCVVIADHLEAHPTMDLDPRTPPIQYRSPDVGIPLLQRALYRATAIAPASQVLIAALEEFREYWEPMAWFVGATHRFVCNHRATLPLTYAAAVVSIAAASPSAVVVVMPARGYVAHEWILKSGLQHALAELPSTCEGIITLGMRDIEENDDEDYLVVSRPAADQGLQVDAFVRRPVPWVAHHLKREGALVASGVLIGYAGAFASYITKHWPGITHQFSRLTSCAHLAGAECELPSDLLRGASSAQHHALRFQPPLLPQRVLAVSRSGWNGLRSPKAVTRLKEFYDRQPRRHHDGIAANLYSSGVLWANGRFSHENARHV